MKLGVLLGLAAAVVAVPSAAQTAVAINVARQAGVVGERYDGYLGFVATPSAEVRRQVGAVNLRRRNLYIGLASRRGVAAQVVGIATACELFPRVGAGEYYMLGDGAWRRRQPGQAMPLPTYCGK